MANYKILQQELDDYDKVMGAYSDAIDTYNTQATEFNKLPYVTAFYSVGGGYQSQLSNGKTYIGYAGDPGTRVIEPTVKGGKLQAAPAPVAPTEPSDKAPSFTRAEARQLQNPPPSLASAVANAPGRLDKIKEQGGMRPEPFLNSDEKGILQRVRAGQL